MISKETSPGFQSTDLYLVCNATEEKIQVVTGTPGPFPTTGKPRAGRGNPPFFASERASMGQGLCHVAPDIAYALSEAGCPVSETAGSLKGIACVRGPGSFTGLRLVLSTVLGLHKAWGVPLAGLEYLPLLARGAGAMHGETVWVLTYSRQRQVYAQSFLATAEEGQGGLKTLSAPEALEIDVAAERIRAVQSPCRILGSGLRKNFDFFSERFSDCPYSTLLPDVFDTPSPFLLLQAAAEAEYAAAPITPLYLRASDAEDNIEYIARKHGFDPEKAVQVLAERTRD